MPRCLARRLAQLALGRVVHLPPQRRRELPPRWLAEAAASEPVNHSAVRGGCPVQDSADFLPELAELVAAEHTAQDRHTFTLVLGELPRCKPQRLRHCYRVIIIAASGMVGCYPGEVSAERPQAVADIGGHSRLRGSGCQQLHLPGSFTWHGRVPARGLPECTRGEPSSRSRVGAYRAKIAAIASVAHRY